MDKKKVNEKSGFIQDKKNFIAIMHLIVKMFNVSENYSQKHPECLWAIPLTKY